MSLRGKLNHKDRDIDINCSCGYPSVQEKVEYQVYYIPSHQCGCLYFFLNYILLILTDNNFFREDKHMHH